MRRKIRGRPDNGRVGESNAPEMRLQPSEEGAQSLAVLLVHRQADHVAKAGGLHGYRRQYMPPICRRSNRPAFELPQEMPSDLAAVFGRSRNGLGEGLMRAAILVGALALVLGLSPVHAQNAAAEHAQDMPSAAEWTSLTDARIDAVKAALDLSPEQAKLWPPVEDAIRARGQARFVRLQALLQPSSEHETVIDLLRHRADNLAQRAGELKRLADAWQPLYQTLDEAQKLRLRILAVYALREMRDRLESRHMEFMDDDDEMGF
jgi:hypothetical protein